MRLAFQGHKRKIAPRPAVYGPGRLRKIGIIGGAPQSLPFAPWADPSWEFWAHSSCALSIPWLRADRLFDCHPKHCFMEARKNGFKDYFGFLKGCPTPIYMQQEFEDVPASKKYPYEMVKMLWPGVPFGSHCAYMVALALYEGCTHLGFWGVDYAHDTEYEKQRSNAEHWVGIARGLGVHIVLPPTTPFCREPFEDYAYQSHSTPEKYAELKKKFAEAKARNTGAKGGFDKSKLLMPAKDADPVKVAEAALALRRAADPAWAREVEKFGPDEAEPDWLKEEVARGTAQRLAEEAGVRAVIARVSAAEGLPPAGSASPESPAAPSVGSVVGSFIGRDASGAGDGVVQPRVSPLPPAADHGGRPADGGQPSRRTAVARARRAARSRRTGTRRRASGSR